VKTVQQVKGAAPASPRLGAPPAAIEEASARLGVIFPPELEAVWLLCNGIELPSGWLLYPVFDRQNPRKTSNDIVYENTKGRWDTMDSKLLAIAGNGTGNQLVLERLESSTGASILVWDHETRRTRPWSKDFSYLKAVAEKRVVRIAAAIARNGHS
jgi:hypothetical protein